MSNSRGQDSISHWIASLKNGNDDAATGLWNRYFSRLCAMARRKLGEHPRRVSDEEDIALSVFDALYNGAKKGRFPKLDDRTDLWRLLVVITSHKVSDRKRRDKAQKRGFGKVGGTLDEVIGQTATPVDLLCLQEECDELLKALANDRLKQVACLKLEGCSKSDIAEKMNVSVRTVERKLELIETIWLSTVDE